MNKEKTSGKFHVEFDANDSFYPVRIYKGEKLILNFVGALRYHEQSALDSDKQSAEDICSVLNRALALNSVFSRGWVDVEDRLPEQDGVYLVTLKPLVDASSTNIGWFRGGKFQHTSADKVIAWQQLPEPFFREKEKL